MVGLDSEGQPNPVVGGNDLMMFSSIVGVDGSAQLPTAHHSPARNLLVSHQNLVEPCSDVVSMMGKLDFHHMGTPVLNEFLCWNSLVRSIDIPASASSLLRRRWESRWRSRSYRILVGNAIEE